MKQELQKEISSGNMTSLYFFAMLLLFWLWRCFALLCLSQLFPHFHSEPHFLLVLFSRDQRCRVTASCFLLEARHPRKNRLPWVLHRSIHPSHDPKEKTRSLTCQEQSTQAKSAAYHAVVISAEAVLFIVFFYPLADLDTFQWSLGASFAPREVIQKLRYLQNSVPPGLYSTRGHWSLPWTHSS